LIKEARYGKIEVSKNEVKKMPKRIHISAEEIKEIEKARKQNKDKTVDKWLEVLLLHAAGEKRKEIAKKTGFGEQYVTELVGEYLRKGLANYAKKAYKGNHRNMNFAAEEAFLDTYKKKAEQGQIIEVGIIKAAYEEKVGHSIGGSQIYRVLHRHGWRKIMPRSKHPNKASAEAIEASKKLTLQ
jgi:transposase